MFTAAKPVWIKDKENEMNVAASFTVTMVNGEAKVETDSTKPYTVIIHK